MYKVLLYIYIYVYYIPGTICILYTWYLRGMFSLFVSNCCMWCTKYYYIYIYVYYIPGTICILYTWYLRGMFSLSISSCCMWCTQVLTEQRTNFFSSDGRCMSKRSSLDEIRMKTNKSSHTSVSVTIYWSYTYLWRDCRLLLYLVLSVYTIHE